jgi:hypothetical protein
VSRRGSLRASCPGCSPRPNTQWISTS